MEKNGAEGANAVLEMVDKSIVAAAAVYAFILYVDVDIVVCLLICMFKRRCVAIYFRMKIMSCHISGGLWIMVHDTIRCMMSQSSSKLLEPSKRHPIMFWPFSPSTLHPHHNFRYESISNFFEIAIERPCLHGSTGRQ